jgi:hypothetical protein
MATNAQKAECDYAGRATRKTREARRDLGTRSPEKVRQLREQAAKSARVCADCFEPLAPDASISIVQRIIEHVPERYNGVGQLLPAAKRVRTVPICIACWLIVLGKPRWWLRGLRQRGSAASPLRALARNRLTVNAASIDLVYAAYPDSLGRNDAIERIGQLPRGGTINQEIAAVVNLGIFEMPRPGKLRAAGWLFPGG